MDNLDIGDNRVPDLDKSIVEAPKQLDFNIIADMPWAQKLWSEIEQTVKNGFLNWCKTVKNLAGTSDQHIHQWSKLYLAAIDEVQEDLQADITRIHTSTIDKIEDLLRRLQNVCIELHEPMPSTIGAKSLSLFEEQNQLMKHIEKYEVIINAKKQELEALQKKQKKLCKSLGRETKFKLQYPPLPTKAQLEQFQKYIDELEAEKFERDEKFCLLKHDIMEYVSELTYKPTCDFERMVLSSDDFPVTTENMKKLEFFSKCLKELRQRTAEEIVQLRNRIEDLWKMLDVDLMDRDEFRSHYTGHSSETLEALRVEVKRCEEIRKANIKTFVEKLRTELELWWKKCHCSDTDSRSFKYFKDNCYTEDLLEIHELEIQKWKKYYEENNRLLSLLENHQELWEKVLELEENATGANRYKNRGGKLLQEEKERNKLSKMIPKIEEEILALSEEYRNKKGVGFMAFGRTPEDYIECLHADRENNRKLKLSARKMQKSTVLSTPGKSAFNLFPSTSTAMTPTSMSATKRKILATPNTENAKRLRATPKVPLFRRETPKAVPKAKITVTTCTLPSQKRKSRSSTELSKRRRSARKSRSQEALKRAQKMPQIVVEDYDSTRNTTYMDFQSELSSRDQCRSTILPDEIQLRTPKVSSPRRKRMAGGRTPSRVLSVKTPTRTPSVKKTPQSRTPNSSSKNITKLSACKSNLKLLF